MTFNQHYCSRCGAPAVSALTREILIALRDNGRFWSRQDLIDVVSGDQRSVARVLARESHLFESSKEYDAVRERRVRVIELSPFGRELAEKMIVNQRESERCRQDTPEPKS